MADDRATLEKVAAGYHELMACLDKQAATQAKMIRACIQRLKSPDSRLRREAIEALGQLADMLEKKNG